MVFATRRRKREPHQGFESRLRHGIHALRFVSGQRRLLCHWGADLQSVSRLSLRCAWKRMGAFASADRALAVVSDGGQDRPPWPADVLEDQHRHVGPVRRDPRALRTHHAGRRCHSGDVVIPGAFALSGSGTMNPDGGAALKPSKAPALTAKNRPWSRLTESQPRLRCLKWAENPIPPKAVASSKISSRILGSSESLPSDVTRGWESIRVRKTLNYIASEPNPT